MTGGDPIIRKYKCSSDKDGPISLNALTEYDYGSVVLHGNGYGVDNLAILYLHFEVDCLFLGAQWFNISSKN